jgi:hypothetical protein
VGGLERSAALFPLVLSISAEMGLLAHSR